MISSTKKWLLFLLLCLIWGSSFILMKLGMYDHSGAMVLNPSQVAAIRILSAGLVLFPFFINALRRIPAKDWGYIILSGMLGSFLPAFLFCMAETRIDSALTAMLNTLTPIFTLFTATLVYKSKIPSNQALGVIIGFLGCLLLFLSQRSEPSGNFLYAGYVLLATICYGLNVNMVRHKLTHVSPVDIASSAFAAFIIPCVFVLFYTGYHHLPLANPGYIWATVAASVLGILGTAIASVIFYILVKMAGSVFASMVTYGIPFVAIGWGLLFGEKISLLELGALIVMLAGVYVASSGNNFKLKWVKRKRVSEKDPA